jgi:hypothetical protein
MGAGALGDAMKDPQAENNRVTLRDYIERIFDERKAALDIAFRAQQEALGLASRTLELRLEKLNELRQEVTSDRANYITRDKYDADMKALNGKIDGADALTRQWQDRADGALNIARFLGVGGSIALLLEIARVAGVLR